MHATEYNLGDDLRFLLKKHLCPYCDTPLKKQWKSNIVDYYSKEAAHYDFSSVDTKTFGKVDFKTIRFVCVNCKSEFTEKELMKYEQNIAE